MKIIKESGMGLSRLLNHTRDNVNFAVIGSQDKDTKEDRSKELSMWVSKLFNKYHSKGIKLSYKKLKGSYTYNDSDEIAEEDSVMIMNIEKGDALFIAKKLNQESIIWKDNDFFGFINCETGEPDGNLSRDLTFKDVDSFGSRLSHKETSNKGRKYAFKLESIKPRYNNAIKNMSNQEPIKEIIDEWSFYC